ncbi:MAG: hypothetical protein RIS20_574 [Bacteroidota bacterium]|jgi:hypothetical protein
MNQSFANKNLKETMGCELVIELMKIQEMKTPTENKMGCFHKYLGIKGLCNWSADNHNISPNSNGSLGRKSPKLELNSSMFMERGVKKAIAMNSFSV